MHHGYYTFAVHHERSLHGSCIFKISIDHLFDNNLQSGKINWCFGKKVWEKSWILNPKICMNSEEDNQKHDKCVVLSEIINFSNLFNIICTIIQFGITICNIIQLLYCFSSMCVVKSSCFCLFVYVFGQYLKHYLCCEQAFNNIAHFQIIFSNIQ